MSRKNYRAADVLAEALVDHGVSRLFCVPGESYLSVLDALKDQNSIDVVAARHEGGALPRFGSKTYYPINTQAMRATWYSMRRNQWLKNSAMPTSPLPSVPALET